MFGNRATDCTEEIAFAMYLLKEKAPTWYEYVVKRTKYLKCESNQQGYSGAVIHGNVVLNMILGKTVSPEVYIAPSMYDDDLEAPTEDECYFMATVLVHESCHVEQALSLAGFTLYLRMLVTNTKYAEIECHTLTDEFLKQIGGAPQ